MSVLFETSLGDIVIDLEVEACPRTCENFLKLCKVYYYNLNAFFNGLLSTRFTCGMAYSFVIQYQKTSSHKLVTQPQQERAVNLFSRS